MELTIAGLLQNFEQGKIDRRQLIRSLAAMVTAAAGGLHPITATEVTPIVTVGINHFSYTASDYTKTRDFYSRILGMQVTADDKNTRCNLRVGDTFMVVRNASGTDAIGIDHICYAVREWKKESVLANLDRQGLKPQPEGDNSLQVKDPDGYHVQLSGREEAPGEKRFGSQRQ
jgi:catechol 2,3-dioxygenase-like lactoylglutathione lyase family enzyme